jgi:hypothetical protein
VIERRQQGNKMGIKKKRENRFGSFALAFDSDRENGVDDITKGWVMSLQAQVPQHINKQNKESKQTRTKQQALQAQQNEVSNNRN